MSLFARSRMGSAILAALPSIFGGTRHHMTDNSVRLALDISLGAVKFSAMYILYAMTAVACKELYRLPVSSKPRVLQRLPRRDPPRRIHAGHLADEIPELGFHLLPPPKGQPRVFLAESTEEVLETLDEGVIVSSVISNEALKIIHLASEERQVAPEYQPCLLLWGSTVRLV